MSADPSLVLLSKILDSGDVQAAIKSGITLDDFKYASEGYMGFQYILEYYKARETSGNVPTREIYESRFPTHVLPEPDRLSLKAAVSMFRQHAVEQALMHMVDEVAANISEPEKAISQIHKTIKEVQGVKRASRDIILSKSMKSAVHDYMLRKNQVGYSGIPYPWDALNEETGGMLGKQYIVFYGRPKSMKTWVGLHCAVTAYNHHNRRVMVYTREMGEEQMRDRSICLLIGAPYSAYRRGKLHEIGSKWGGTMEDRFLETAEAIAAEEEIAKNESGYNKGLLITSDRDDPRGGGINGIRAKIEEWEPDLVFIDGIYLLRNDRSNRRSVNWEDQYAVSQDVRDLALDYDLPVIGTTQGNRGGKDNFTEGSDDIAFADSTGMDAELAVKIIKKRTSDPERNELALLVKVAREVNMYGFAINGNAATNFGQLYYTMRDPGTNNVVTNPDTGEPMREPVIFREEKEIKAMLKHGEGWRQEGAGEEKREKRKGSLKADVASLGAQYAENNANAKRTGR